MPLNNARDAIEAKRLELVSSMRLRGFTQRAIQEVLAKQMRNPQTGEPYSLGTINGDIKKLERQWRKAAADTMEEHKARQLAEIGEVKRAAWVGKDHAVVLRALDLESNITGTKAASKSELTGKDGGPVQHKHEITHDLTRLSAAELDALESLVAKATGDAASGA